MADSEIRTIGQALQTTALFNRPFREETCPEHGAYQSTQYPSGNWSACLPCDQRAVAEQREREWNEQQARSKERMKVLRLERSLIPKRFAGSTFENFVPHMPAASKALGLIRAYAEEFDSYAAQGTSLILCGGVGTGKTHLAIGLANCLMEQSKQPVFISVMNAVRRVKETYSRGSDLSEREAIESFIAPDLLILDEVGAQFGSDTEKLILFEIINGRYEQMKPSVVISNLAVDALTEFVGERAVDRLRENGGRLIAFDWPSYRRKVGKETS